MGGRSGLVATLIAAGLTIGGAATAGIPDPEFSNIGNVVYAPGGEVAYEVTIGSSDGPVEGAVVRLRFTAEAEGLICWCDGQTHPEIDAVTDLNGVASFNISAGGCLDPALLGAPPVEVFADGIFMKAVGAVSPDGVDGAGLPATGGWNPGTTCAVSVGDAVFHTSPLKTGTYSFCTDFDSDLDCDLTDAVILTSPVKVGDFCPHTGP